MTLNQNYSNSAFYKFWLALAFVVLIVPVYAQADGVPDDRMRGNFVVSLHGSFKSPPPPFTGDAIKLDAAIVGQYKLDGEGNVTGEQVLSFSNAAVPMGLISRHEISGSYTHAPNGHLVLFLEEDGIDPVSGPDGITDNTLVLECYLVHRVRAARCVLHSLVSFQQGENPRPLPATMSGSLERQQ